MLGEGWVVKREDAVRSSLCPAENLNVESMVAARRPTADCTVKGVAVSDNDMLEGGGGR